MIRKLSFRADPATPYHALEFHVRKAERIGIKEPFSDEGVRRKIILETADHLCQLLNIPVDFNIVFLSRISTLNEAISKAYNYQSLNFESDDTFLERGLEARESIHFSPEMNKATDRIHNDISLFCFKDLDPFTGEKTIFSESLYSVGYSSQLLIHGDLSYTAPTGMLEYSQVHSLVFQTQYGFGMPPGIIVWISREPFYGKVMAHLKGRKEFYTYSSGPGSSRFIHASGNFDKLYVLGMIIKDLQNRGLQMVRNEIKYKSIVLYNALKVSRRFEPLIPDMKAQSENIICGRSEASKEELETYFSGYGIEVDLYDDVHGNSIVRLANYPAHSKEQVEYLSDLLAAF